MPKPKLRVFVAAGCGPCQEVKDAVAAGRFNAEDVDIIDVESKEGFTYIKKFGLTKAPAAFLGKKECELFINREDNSLFIDCPDNKKPPRLPQRVAEPS
ncbi:hypothetical protein LCGC14_1172400 [marine sediment metagenome]|uniref:Thioredoxin-like fold domain-containing protein n=1 Tax=marine sediment metagenome TaxID=412755 RepID=A0A0F9MCC5_9ZZZZ